MNEPYAYRAGDELAAALLEFRKRAREFDTQVDAWNAEHPQNTVWWGRGVFSADPWPRGFEDGDSDAPPPSGLSRAKGRPYLVPRKGKTGQPWQDVLDRFTKRPAVGEVFRKFNVREHGDGPGDGRGGYYIAATQWADADVDGVIVVCSYDIGAGKHGEPGLSEHLTPMPLSEFYRIKERLDASRKAA